MAKSKGIISRIPITKARVNLGAVVRDVYNKKSKYILEKDGYPVAVILSMEDVEDIIDTKELEKLDKSAKSFIKIEDIKRKYAV